MAEIATRSSIHQPNSAQMNAMFTTYHAPLLRYVSRFVNDPDDAADVVATVFSKACIAVPVENPGPWLYTLAHNAAIDALRRKRHHAAIEGLEESVPDHEPLPETHALRAEENYELRAWIAELPALQRRAMELRYFKDMSTPEIAEELGCKVGNVRVLLHRALHTLRSRHAGAVL